MHLIGSMILDGGINFGIATAMYKGNSNPVHLWSLPNSLAGDAAVTLIIQQLLTWVLDRLSIRGDVRKGLVAPLRMPANAHAVLRWFVGLKDVRVHTSRKDKIKHYIRFNAPRYAAYFLASFVIYWPITMGILAGLKAHGIGKDYSGKGGDFNNWPMPQIFKGVYGAVVGLTTPFVSYIALIYEGETGPEGTDFAELSRRNVGDSSSGGAMSPSEEEQLKLADSNTSSQ
ncbi:hypothetical protein BGZ99_002120 [Dissophora globulifera]|uniref:Uncharacterized protein n=1 Tax=Dissophora globulifera TaxID=979702 RepID=A0A9P6RVG3_9FUNG|nr:hypothetical protein BGZ99_002120 [Dissophora globulifera]